MKNQTIEYYDTNAKEYAEKTFKINIADYYDSFLKYISRPGKIMDLGCGSGRDTIYFRGQGFEVVPVDGSMEMCKVAFENTGQYVRNILFQDLDYDSEFDGVWACASLLHVPKKQLPEIMKKINNSLVDGGIFFTCFKYGHSEEISEGRFYNNMTEIEASDIFFKSEFEILELNVSNDSQEDRTDLRWVNIIGRKL